MSVFSENKQSFPPQGTGAEQTAASYRDIPYTASKGDFATPRDIENGPAPPYEVGLAQGQPKWAHTSGSKGPWWKRRSAWVLFLCLVVFVTTRTKHVKSASPRQDTTKDTPNIGKSIEEQEHGDGQEVSCASFDQVQWQDFPASLSSPHMPSPFEGGSRKSTNVTFLLPTGVQYGQLFSHLSGAAGIGSFFVSSYEPDETSAYQDQDGLTIGGNGVHQGEGQVRVVVESIVDVLPEEDGVGEDNVGYKFLKASRVCLMSRKGDEAERNGKYLKSDSEDLGVGIYTVRPDDVPREEKRTPLQFRVYISIPLERKDATLTSNAVLETAAKDDYPIRAMNIRGQVGGIYIDDIASSHVGTLNAETAVGNVEFEKVRAEVIRLKSATGSVRGWAEVSDELQVETSV
jgi:hypothetical protein